GLAASPRPDASGSPSTSAVGVLVVHNVLDLCRISWYPCAMAKKGRWATHRERLKAVQLLDGGKAVAEIVQMLQVGRSRAYEWQAKYRQGGPAALSTRFSSGRPTTLSDKQLVQLYSLLVGKDPRQYSLGFALWTRKLVAELIHQKFGIRMSLVT